MSRSAEKVKVGTLSDLLPYILWQKKIEGTLRGHKKLKKKVAREDPLVSSGLRRLR